MNTDAFNRAQSNYDAMTPADRREPTDEDIRLYAEHIKPKLLASKYDASELARLEVDGKWWVDLWNAIYDGEMAEVRMVASLLLNRAAHDEAERIASDELYGDDDHSATLQRIGADDWRTFFAKLNEERQV